MFGKPEADTKRYCAALNWRWPSNHHYRVRAVAKWFDATGVVNRLAKKTGVIFAFVQKSDNQL
ncbi:hypothetical protein O9929_05475 [Vibrio lentus]|nr:hypothetical protein [Vibrio lentus]